MKAQEMFEKLGFRKNKSICYDEQHILYEKTVMNETDILSVYFENGQVTYTNCCMRCIKMDKEIIKAIHQQMKELGW